MTTTMFETIANDPLSEFPPGPAGDSDISSGGGGVGRRPVPWLLVLGPVAGVERLRADRGFL
jgi:hypothetical protein